MSRRMLVATAVLAGAVGGFIGGAVALVFLSVRAMDAAQDLDAIDDGWLGPRTIPGRRP